MLAALAIAIFAILFLRLWALEVLSGDRYLNAAQSNQLRILPTEAPRGSIVDRAGRTIVANVPGTAVQFWPADLPEEGRYAMFKKLSTILRVPFPRLTKALAKGKDDPLTPILVKTAVHEDQVMYLKEHRREFPGVEIVPTYLRDYPYRTLAAQVLGYVGEISPEELKRLARTAIAAVRRSARRASKPRSTRICAGMQGTRSSGSTRSVSHRAELSLGGPPHRARPSG